MAGGVHIRPLPGIELGFRQLKRTIATRCTLRIASQDEVPMTGVIDRKYRLIRELGKGAMGSVHEAVHLVTERHVAVKVIATDELLRQEQVVDRFLREMRAAGRIETRHVAQVLDSGVDPDTGRPYMVMELLRGADLRSVMRRLGPLRPD